MIADSNPPDLLAIGIGRGGRSPANHLINEALMGSLRMVVRERMAFRNDGLRINIVFHIPGPIFSPTMKELMRRNSIARLDRKNDRVLAVAAVPETLKFDEVSRHFADILRDARRKAIEYAAKRRVAASHHVGGLIDHLLNQISAATR